MLTKKQLLFVLLIGTLFLPGYSYFILTLICTPLVYIISTNEQKSNVIVYAIYLNVLCSLILLLSWVYNSSALSFDFLRDFIYLLKVSNGFVVGYLFVSSKDDFITYIKVILCVVIISVLIYFINIIFYLVNRGNPFELSPNEFRMIFGSGDFLVAFVFIYYLSLKKNAYENILIFTLLCSILVMQSRTMLLLPISFFLYKAFTKFKKYKLLIIFLLCSMLIVIFNNISVDRDINGDSFGGKIVSSIVEVVPDDYDAISDIGYHWRGYETYWAFKKIKNSNIIQYLFGYGADSKVELPIYMKLAGNEYDAIPFVHNGYLLIMIKGGIVSLLIFLYWHFYMLRMVCFNNDSNINEQLLFSLIIFSLGSTFFMAGVFEANDWAALLIILGMLYSDCKSNNNKIIKG